MKIFYIDSKKKLIFIKLKTFYKKKNITFKYKTPYMYKENGLAERKQQIIIIIKNLLPFDNRLLLDFWAKIIDTTNYL